MTWKVDPRLSRHLGSGTLISYHAPLDVDLRWSTNDGVLTYQVLELGIDVTRADRDQAQGLEM